MEPKQQIQTIQDTEIPIWELPELPENAHVIMLAKQYVPRYGCDVWAWYRLPINRLKGTTVNNPATSSISGGGFNNRISSTKVVPAYINQAQPYDIRRASSTNPSTFAKFLIVGQDPNNDGNYLVQSSGVHHFQDGHGYLVGRTYYLADDGTPSTLKPKQAEKVQKLFYVLDENTIDIQVG